jgi:ATP-binding cassette subfamily B protein
VHLKTFFSPLFPSSKTALLSIVGLGILLTLSQFAILIEPLLIQFSVDRILPNKDLEKLFLIIGAAVLIRVLSMVLHRVQSGLRTDFARRTFSRFLVDFYKHLQGLDLAFFADTKMGEFNHRLGQDTYHIYRFLFSGLPELMSNLILVIIFIIYGLFLSPLLTLITFSLLPLYLLAQKYSGKKIRVSTEHMVEKWKESASFQSEKLAGIRLIKELNAEKTVLEKFKQLTGEASESFRRLELAHDLGLMLSHLAMFLIPMIVLSFGGAFYVFGTLSLGALIAFFYFCGRLFSPVENIVQQYLLFQRMQVGLERVNEYYERRAMIDKNGERVLPRTPLAVEFDHVHFSYGKGRRIHSELSFILEAGKSLGISGASGIGKSTIANLLFRFWEPESGCIKIAGEDIQDLDIDKLRSRIGIVSQDTILFHDTISENLLLANPEATLGSLQHACKVAGILDFIEGLPEGFNTIVGERGVKLSGGQRQRLSIARVVLKNPDIIIFDEATSHLDSELENKILASISEIAKGKTLLMIAHRLSTLKDCDLFLELSDSGARVFSSYDELLEAKHVAQDTGA